jgi:hypothetical protein
MRVLFAAATLLAAAILPAPLLAAAVPVSPAARVAAGIVQPAYTAGESRAIRRCMRNDGYRAGRGRGSAMARAARAHFADACARKLYGA